MLRKHISATEKNSLLYQDSNMVWDPTFFMQKRQITWLGIPMQMTINTPNEQKTENTLHV